MQPTALVHELYLRLFGSQAGPWENRRHFFGAAARALRQIRVDHARKKKRLKRGGLGAAPAGSGTGDAAAGDGAMVQGPAPQPAGGADVELIPGPDEDPAELLAVHEALERLEGDDPRKAEIVQLRYFAGLTEEETAEATGLSRRTIQLEWQVARAWLHRELSKGDTNSG